VTLGKKFGLDASEQSYFQTDAEVVDKGRGGKDDVEMSVAKLWSPNLKYARKEHRDETNIQTWQGSRRARRGILVKKGNPGTKGTFSAGTSSSGEELSSR